jgi:hypothetical protein
MPPLGSLFSPAPQSSSSDPQFPLDDICFLFRRNAVKRRNCPPVQSQKEHFSVRAGLQVLVWF